MDLFLRFNRKNIQDRQVDTLVGLSKGLIADGKIDRTEVDFLFSWLIQNQHTSNPLILNLTNKINSMLEDGIIDTDESSELLKLLRSFAGEKSEIGELAKATSLPINNPLPKLQFSGMSYLFTGTCAYGTRKECQNVIESLGGINASSVTKSLNYLVIGTYVTDSWAHESFGRKIEKAMEYRNNGVSLAIIPEEHWANEAGL